MYSIGLGQNRDEMWAAVKTVMNFAFHKMESICWQAEKIGLLAPQKEFAQLS